MTIDALPEELDKALVNAAKPIKLLSHLSWDPIHKRRFLKGIRGRSATLPAVEYPTKDFSAQRRILDSIVERAETVGDEVGRYLAETAESYGLAAQLLEHAGTPRASEISMTLYGGPGDRLVGSSRSNLDAARYFLDVTQTYAGANSSADDPSLSPEQVAAYIQAQVDQVLVDDTLRVTVDPSLASKAAAGIRRIRLRADTSFSRATADQLLQHEAFVHSLTALNGMRQPLQAFALGAPRTTATQEGLATFAELVTGVIDLSRMARIALRIEAIEAALAGADFIEVFRLFVAHGQDETESFNSSMRVFRGVPVSGGCAFSKDGVYLQGLLEVHTFFRWCLQEKRLDLMTHLFSGRMTLKDALHLAPMFERHALQSPHYLPPWLSRKDALTAYLAFSVFANAVQLHELTEAEFGASI